jgi:predicted transcriptional regulator
MNVSTLSRKLNLTTQECSRHVSRLSDATLIEKDNNGRNKLTQYGQLFLKLMPGQRFVVKHRDYFQKHSLEKIPYEFLARIGELSISTLTPDVMVTMSIIQTLFENAEDYIRVMHDRYLMNILPLSADAIRRGVKIRTLDTLPKELGLNQKRPTYISEVEEELFFESWRDGKMEVRKSDFIDLFLYLSEREAVIAFPLIDGSFDYLGFYSEDQVMLGYCLDLFDFYYENGKEPPRGIVEELYENRLKYHRNGKKTDESFA